MKGPFANYTGAMTKDRSTLFDSQWRVSIIYRGEPHAIGGGIDFHFASRRDAELAAKALIAAGLDTPEKLIKAGWPTVKRTMCDALMW